MNGFLVPPSSRQEIKTLALEIRKRFNLDEPFFPVVELIEFVLTMLDTTFRFEIVEDLELGSDAANYNPKANLMKIRQSVYDGAVDKNGRDRFTLAHEVGHYFMHRFVDLELSRMYVSNTIPAFCNSEWQANTFAAALLMPDHIIADLCPDEISRICGTSFSAAEIAYKQKKK